MADRRPDDTFTEAEYEADRRSVIEYAIDYERAVVMRPDGTPRVVISIPKADPVVDELVAAVGLRDRLLAALPPVDPDVDARVARILADALGPRRPGRKLTRKSSTGG